MSTTIYPARRIITMNKANPFAEAVAVRDGRVLGTGTVAELQQWETTDNPVNIDDSFAGHVVMPGFIEAHTHVMAGGMWTMPYVGFFDRRSPDGAIAPGCTSIADVVDRLIEAEAAMSDSGTGPSEPLVAWGLDPIYFPTERLLAHHLDRVSETRPIFVFHASAHLATVNTAQLQEAEITAATPTPGISLDAAGRPDGELQEPPAMGLARRAIIKLSKALYTPEAYWNYAREARNSGHTLVTDLGTTRLTDERELEQWKTITSDPDYPVRVMVAMGTLRGGTVDELSALGPTLDEHANAKLRFGIVKLVLDGSIQGFTARVSWPHYLHPPEGHPGNGLWLIAPDQLAGMLRRLHDDGLTIHVHCNGDEATEVYLDAMEEVLTASPRPDHRHTVQHCQLTTPAQYARMAALGMCANIFANHIFHWGDQHRDITLGPERARGMDACATALRAGVSIAIHSDAPVTPMGHLHTAWCAVNRLTASGEVLGPDERISVEQALEAITLGAAHQLKLDHEMGSIEAGKLADFAILADDPLEVDPVTLKDIEVWGTVLGGVPFPAGG